MNCNIKCIHDKGLDKGLLPTNFDMKFSRLLNEKKKKKKKTTMMRQETVALAAFFLSKETWQTSDMKQENL